jgi:lipopolysaccharide export system permease protein
MKRFFRPLDRYVFTEFWRVFLITSLGFPLIVIVMDLTEKLDRYMARELTTGQIALSYFYWIPESMFMVLPAAVLFATVFTIGAFTRHSEITAAKASGVSFHRMARPIFVGAAIVSVFALVLSEVVPGANARRSAIVDAGSTTPSRNDRANFAYAGEFGRVYKIGGLSVQRQVIDNLEIERRGRGPDFPTYLLTARTGQWDAQEGWTFSGGQLHVLPDDNTNIVFSFDSLRDKRFTERPTELTANPRSPDEMRFSELGRFIRAMERSGTNVNTLKVEQALKIAIPITCIIIAFFGAPLATSTQRGGTAFGIGISLATTVFFLVLIQLTKAIGGGGLLPPYLAAWLPNVIFGTAGAILLARTRT